jgi:hypothetical protein
MHSITKMNTIFFLGSSKSTYLLGGLTGSKLTLPYFAVAAISFSLSSLRAFVAPKGVRGTLLGTLGIRLCALSTVAAGGGGRIIPPAGLGTKLDWLATTPGGDPIIDEGPFPEAFACAARCFALSSAFAAATSNCAFA